MKTYLEIHVPISYDSLWFYKLRSKFSDVSVNWQHDYYHITLAFCDVTPAADLRPILEKHLSSFASPVLCFDKLDVFEIQSGMFFIHLGISDVPDGFKTLVDNIRNDLKRKGCVMKSNFNPHVTLGRLKDPSTEISKIKETLDSVSSPSLTLKLSDIEYKVFGTRKVIYKTRLR